MEDKNKASFYVFKVILRNGQEGFIKEKGKEIGVVTGGIDIDIKKVYNKMMANDYRNKTLMRFNRGNTKELIGATINTMSNIELIEYYKKHYPNAISEANSMKDAYFITYEIDSKKYYFHYDSKKEEYESKPIKEGACLWDLVSAGKFLEELIKENPDLVVTLEKIQ